MDQEYELGLNVLQRMISKGFESYGSDELECMAYNVSLDLVLRLFEKYPSFKRISIWSNTERVTFSEKNKTKIMELVGEKRISFFHIPENVNAIHAKLYMFRKNGQIQFLAVGSPNFSEHSNQNFETLVYVNDPAECDTIWTEIPKICTGLNLQLENSVPLQISQALIPEAKMDQKFFEGLWKHQVEVLLWLAGKRFSIVNIPPGTGKTQIAFTYLRYLFEQDASLTAVVLVPTTTLLTQWKNRLGEIDVEPYELGTDLSNLGAYFADPSHKVLVTLYSRFFEQYREFQKRAKILKPNMLLILDECHNSYGHIDDLLEFKNMMESLGALFAIGLSATIDSFRVWEVQDFVNLMGGTDNRFEISLPRFYAHWNDLNDTPVLKSIKYVPIKYCLSNAEMDELKEFSKKVAIQMGMKTITGRDTPTWAIKRAQWLRGLPGGVRSLQNYVVSHMDGFADRATIIFVQTNEIAEYLRTYIANQPGWNPLASIYVYDSSKDQDFLSYALDNFKKKLGFCLISEKMLSEGFDLPKVDRIILHGSDKSPRDWIQKIGRAIRFDKKDPDSVAEIADVVFCEPNGQPLALEQERYECLTSISQ